MTGKSGRMLIVAVLFLGLSLGGRVSGSPASSAAPAPEPLAEPLSFVVGLQPGWNLLSIPLVPLSTAVGDVLSSISDRYSLVYAYDARDSANPWRRYDPAAPAALNDLAQINERMGFWVYATNVATLKVTGTAPTSTNVQLAPGWNLLGCPFLTSQPVSTVLAPVEGQYDLVYAFKPGVGWLKYHADPAVADDFGTMDPGMGYWVHAAGLCPASSGRQYNSGPAQQYDKENPVRPAYNHPDKNLALRSYTPNTSPTLKRELVSYGTDDPTQPPQLATLFSPARVPALVGIYQVYGWNWAPSPDPGTRGAPITNPPVTALGLQTTPGEPLHVPASGYDIGQGMEVLVLFADEDSITLKYTREDSAATGYTLHIDKVCPDPNLLALYRALDDPSGPRYVYTPADYWYNLPALAAGQVFGTAQSSEVVVAIRDTGSFMDPRSCNEWWQVRPGYAGTCPPHD